MFSLDSLKWDALANFALKLGAKEDFIERAEKDLRELFALLEKTRIEVMKKYQLGKLERTLSWANLCVQGNNAYGFFVLYLSGFSQTALRELRLFLEASARSYYIDSSYQKLPISVKCQS